MTSLIASRGKMTNYLPITLLLLLATISGCGNMGKLAQADLASSTMPTLDNLDPRPSTVLVSPAPVRTLAPTATIAPTTTMAPVTTSRSTAFVLPETETPLPLTVVPLQFERPFTQLPTDLLTKQMAQWQLLADEQDELSLEALLHPARPAEKQILTSVEAQADVDYLFRLLPHGYAGYGFFNEGDRFGLAQQQLLATLQERDEITSDELAAFIHEQLSFIQDCHLRIGDQRFFSHLDYWYWDGVDFFEENGRYRFQRESDTLWLDTINNKPPTAYMKQTLNAAGDPVYHLGLLSHTQPDDFTLAIRQPDGTQTAMTGEWKQSVFSPPEDDIFNRFEAEGIPIIVSRWFWGDENRLAQFVADAENVREEPILVVDIRGNGGGISWWPRHWLQTLVDVEIEPALLIGELQTKTAVAGKVNWPNSEFLVKELLDRFLVQLEALQSGASERGWHNFISDTSPIPNPNQLLVVLIDRHTASSAEGFITNLLQMEHVVFVGENSQGCVHYGDTGFYYLPNSGIAVQLGTKLFLTPQLDHIEGVGFQPDLWVPAEQALPRTLAAIRKGWLQPPK